MTDNRFENLSDPDKVQAIVAAFILEDAFRSAAEDVRIIFAKAPDPIKHELIRHAAHERVRAVADLLSDGTAQEHKQAMLLIAAITDP